MKHEMKSELSLIPLFSELSEKELEKVVSFCRIVNYLKNDFLFFQDDAYAGFYILLEGAIKVYKQTQDGKESVVHLIKPSNVFADIPLFEGKNYPVTAQSIEDSILIFIPKDNFLQLLTNHPEMSLKMLAGFSKRMRELIDQIEIISCKEVTNRLAKYLFTEISIRKIPTSDDVLLKLTVPKSTIASYLGTITETLSRSFKKLQDDNIIAVNGKNVHIKNLPKLIELSKQ